MNWQDIRQHRWARYLTKIFNQGLTPKDMALSITLGAIIGVIPLIGVATPVITLLIIYLRLNLPIALFITYAVSPLHILLFIPFIYVGEHIFGVAHLLTSVQSIKDAFSADFMTALGDLAFQLACGITGWALIGVPVAIAMFCLLYGMMSIFSTKKS